MAEPALWRVRIAALVSALLHVLLLAGLLVLVQRPPPAEAPDKLAQVELLTLEQAGSGETTVAAPDAVLAETPPTQPTPPPDQAEGPPTPEPPPPAPRPTETAMLKMNLGGTDSESNAIVQGENIIPASPDNRARNRPPIYPVDAARRGQHGSVLVVIHISPEGLAIGADVVQSSGYPALDQAARDAVLAWRFVPAVKNGAPIPFDMPFSIVFRAD